MRPPGRACAPRRCAISTPPVPTPRRRSARRTSRKPISCRSRSTRHWVCARPLSCTDPDYPTDDGSCVRDYVHVTDLADAHLRAVQWLVRQKVGRGRHDVFNLGSGTGHSVRQVGGLDQPQSSGGRFPMSTAPADPAIRRGLVGCIDKAQRELGWTPLARPRDPRSRIRCDGGCPCRR